MTFITVTEAARKSGLSSALIRRAAKDGKISGAVLFGKTWVFTPEAFEDWRASSRKPGNPQWKKPE